jgi:hypothetical protein
MGDRLLYEAGNRAPQRYVYTFDLLRAGFAPCRAEVVSRFVEFWCQSNCQGRWRVEQTERGLTVSFAMSHDAVLFCVGEEYDMLTAYPNCLIERVPQPF